MCLHAWNLLSHTYTLRNTNALTSCRLSPVSAAGYWDVRRRCTRFFLLLLLLLLFCFPAYNNVPLAPSHRHRYTTTKD